MNLISPNCEHPYGDSCGYCFKCKEYQEKYPLANPLVDRDIQIMEKDIGKLKTNLLSENEHR